MNAGRRKKFAHSPVQVEPVASAREAGLRYVSDNQPGIVRIKRGKNFVYQGPDGKRITDAAVLKRIRSLVIPPAWSNVWICPHAEGHLQATGRDARGRKQYRYHPRWRLVRDDTKYGRMIAFGKTLPRIRERVEQDLALPGLPREKVLATIVRLLETTFIRVGNDEYAKTNKSFGLTTMRDNHVKINGSKLHFRFRGKSGKTHEISLEDKYLASIVKRCRDIPGYELFQYVDESGERRTVDSADVNAYLKEISGEEFTAKDFRTWAGTVLAALALQEVHEFTSNTEAKRNVVRAIEQVAQRLGNTPSVCRKCYIHPAILDTYLNGRLAEVLQQRVEQEISESLTDLRPEEAAVMTLLQKRLQEEVQLRAA